MAKGGAKGTEYKKLTASLREFTASLPSESEKQELQGSINTVVNFLSAIQRLIAATPTRENTSAIEDALQTLDRFVDQAKSNPGVAVLLGIPRPRPSKSKPASFTSEETGAAQKMLSEIQNLPLDEMRARLRNEETVPLRMLQAIAAKIGIRSVQRMGRDVLEHQIASRLANYRGYQELRAGESA